MMKKPFGGDSAPPLDWIGLNILRVCTFVYVLYLDCLDMLLKHKFGVVKYQGIAAWGGGGEEIDSTPPP